MQDRDFKKLVTAVCGMCDSTKRLENAILSGDRDDIVYYVEEAKQRRLRSEKALLDIPTGRDPAHTKR